MGRHIKGLVCVLGLLLSTMGALAQVPSQHDKYQSVEKTKVVLEREFRPARKAQRAIKDKRWAAHQKTPKSHQKPILAQPKPIPQKEAKTEDFSFDPLSFLAELGEKLDDSGDDYLCRVYHRTPVKADSSGDFSWKDRAAAKRMKMGLCQYVIMGMHPQLRKNLVLAGRAMDEAGIRWSMSSAFRDDYRQKIAAGFKAGPCGSQHGGSCVTKGHGDGRAIDIIGTDNNHGAVWTWLDKNGRKYGLYRPMPGADPPHLQANNLIIPAETKTRYASRKRSRNS